jgi:hypothetical protein
MNKTWYLIGAVAIGILVFLYLVFWCASPCQ